MEQLNNVEGVLDCLVALQLDIKCKGGSTRWSIGSMRKKNVYVWLIHIKKKKYSLMAKIKIREKEILKSLTIYKSIKQKRKITEFH